LKIQEIRVKKHLLSLCPFVFFRPGISLSEHADFPAQPLTIPYAANFFSAQEKKLTTQPFSKH
jgi:hypothetical protein